MSIFSDIYTQLNVTGITSIVDDISPYVRARGTNFPCVLIEVPTETYERNSSGTYRKQADVTVTCIARSVVESEEVAAAVLGVLATDACSYIESVSREYEEGYDDDSVGLFIVSINYTYNTYI
jgi:hypothetical protein